MTSDRAANHDRPKPFERVNPQQRKKQTTVIGLNQASPSSVLPLGTADVSERPHFDYDYYDENDDQFIGKIRAQVSDTVGGSGVIVG